MSNLATIYNADPMSSLSEIEGWRHLSLEELARKVAGLSAADRDEIARMTVSSTAETKFIPNAGPQMAAFFSPADLCFYGGAAGGGKMLDINELIPTPQGWTRMADIVPGDEVFDQSGAVCTVTAISAIESRKTYRLTFDDGTTVICCSEHEWLTYDATELSGLLRKSDEWRARRRDSRPSKAKGNKSAVFTAAIAARNAARAGGAPAPTGTIRTTQKIVDSLVTKRGRRNHAVPVAEALDLPDAELPIDPYILGAWLGDGDTASAGFTGIDEPIWKEIEACGFTLSHAKNNPQDHYILGLQKILRRNGLLGRKHVPSSYLRGSVRQRLRLLQGLMDTDGHAALDGGCEFDNTNLGLTESVYEIVTSLGIKASFQEGVAKLNGRVIGPKYRVKFVTTLPVFLLPRKATRMKGWIRQTARFRYIVDAIEIDPVPMRCIAVDSPSRLYLCSKSFVPTHNSALIVGLAMTQHQRSLIMREQYNDLDALTEELIKMNGSRKGFNGSNPPSMRMDDGRFIQFTGAVMDQWRGHAFDFKAIDECSQIAEEVIRYHVGWLRSVVQGQRKRVLLASNPPTDERGQYLVGMFGPWLDPTHPKPAKDGELRWYVKDPEGYDMEVPGPEPIQFPGEEFPTEPMSRTFIRAKLADNPYLAQTGYRKSLDQMDEPYRSAMRDGNFFAARRDKPDQVIPMDWIKAAQSRWTPKPPRGLRMTAIGLDVGQGGADRVVAAPRYGFWYDQVKVAKGKEAPDGPTQAAFAERYRRDGAPIVVDVGGGFGGDVCSVFKSNKTPYARFNGTEEGIGKANDGSGRGFENRRAQAWWRFREALNPDQPGGSDVCLPPDAELASELSAPMLVPEKRDIQIESKKQIRVRLQRSIDKADAVVMAWDPGERALKKSAANRGGGQPERANLGYSDIKKGFLGR